MHRIITVDLVEHFVESLTCSTHIYVKQTVYDLSSSEGLHISLNDIWVSIKKGSQLIYDTEQNII